MLSNSYRYISIDVECVATGYGHRDLRPASVAVVDENLNCLLNTYIEQPTPPLDYLTPFSGLKEEDFRDAISFEDAIRQVKQLLGKDVILVGQAIENDIAWLGLIIGVDFNSFIDLAEHFRYGRYYFSLDFECQTLLSISEGKGLHNAKRDATRSMRLYLKYKTAKAATEASKLLQITRKQLNIGRRPASYKGICSMPFDVSRCICGQPRGCTPLPNSDVAIAIAAINAISIAPKPPLEAVDITDVPSVASDCENAPGEEVRAEMEGLSKDSNQETHIEPEACVKVEARVEDGINKNQNPFLIEPSPETVLKTEQESETEDIPAKAQIEADVQPIFSEAAK